MINNPVLISFTSALIATVVTVIITSLEKSYNIGGELGKINQNSKKIENLEKKVNVLNDKKVDKEMCNLMIKSIKEQLEMLNKKANENHKCIKSQMTQISKMDTKMNLILESNGVDSKKEKEKGD